MKKILLVLLIVSIYLISKNMQAQNKNSRNAEAIAGGLLAIGAGISAVNFK